MNLRAALFNAPGVAVSRRRLLVGAAGLVCLAALVIAHTVALTTLLGGVAAVHEHPFVIGLLWFACAVALFFIGRGFRYVLVAWRAERVER